MNQLLSVVLGLSVVASQASANQNALETMDLEALMSLDVQATSVMKRVESVYDTPASMYVLTNEQIHRAGVENLSQAIGLLPGIFVRDADNSKIALGIRKSPNEFGSNILVMIDGRYFYNPAFQGVTWDALDIPLETIARIELIRGSGGTLWSTKASSGVINIITKHSIDTQGFEVTTATGDPVNRQLNLRYGGLFGQTGSYRMNLKSQGVKQSEGFDGNEIKSFTSRLDYSFSDDLSLLLTAGYQNGDIDRLLVGTVAMSTEPRIYEDKTTTTTNDVMIRLDHRLSANKTQLLQMSYSVLDIETDSFARGKNSIFNLNYAMNSEFERHKLDWGLEYQYNDVLVTGNEMIYLPPDLNTQLHNYGFFLQDQYQLVPDQTQLTLAIRVDKDPITNWLYQPSVKIMQNLGRHGVLWAGVSRSVQSSTLFDKYLTWLQPMALLQVQPYPNPPFPVTHYLKGGPDIKSVKFDNLELGYRMKHELLEMDLSLYRISSDNDYGVQTTFDPSILELNSIGVNGVKSVKTGAEAVFNFQPRHNWNLQLGLNYLNYEARALMAGIVMPEPTVLKQVSLRSDYQVSPELNTYVRIEHQNDISSTSGNDIPDYTSVDAGVTWQVNPSLELGLYGRNLFDSKHLEFEIDNGAWLGKTEIERSFFARAVVKF
ncbi:TonB-dependent receptor plug domain-containing protein [Amphritea balenae]|uniref:TonB-dependent receptor n=1 Tax=Amphritea balenae TaxID=452629 RepID=A0A3P1SU71_9GAMM|nr:TonB-dependent receptor [Amphritea balenae]RRD00485.1 TonB-dependent receptor [Amphritea balenae]GGK70368.1 hypothetical protein GCM10007941_20770 [Amphritea balenae]